MTTAVIKPTHHDRSSGEIPGGTGGKFIFEMTEPAITPEFVAKDNLVGTPRCGVRTAQRAVPTFKL